MSPDAGEQPGHNNIGTVTASFPSSLLWWKKEETIVLQIVQEETMVFPSD